MNQLKEGIIKKIKGALGLRRREARKRAGDENELLGVYGGIRLHQDSLKAKNDPDYHEATNQAATQEYRKAARYKRRFDKVAQGKNPFKEETMNPITAGIKNIQEGNLERMRQNFNDALSRKAAEALQEKKLEVATNYFGQK
jgi:hypothetical protein